MSTAQHEHPVPIGSTWYAWGHHWKVDAHGERDGEPAVHTKLKHHPRKGSAWVIADKLVRHGKRTDV